MSPRVRAVGFWAAALFSAAAAAALADGYGDSVVRGYGELRPVVVATAALPAGKTLDPGTAATDLEVRKVPVRFAPPGVLAVPAEAIGLVPAAPVPAGSYLSAAQLRSPRGRPAGGVLAPGRRPVEIEVGGSGALAALGASPVGATVDVVVTTEPSGSGEGRTYVAAPGVPLLGLAPGAEGPEGERAAATLGLTRRQALRLIDAESFARRITLVPRG
jgi:Flp pilus assembly protein CpaB